MKNLSIILFSALLALAACTKSKEVHPEIGDGNDEIVTVGMKDVHVEYVRTDHAELNRVVFHYSLTQVQQFEAAEMTKRETFFELTLNDLVSDTLYDYYYELFSSVGETAITEQKTFHTQAFDAPEPPEPPTPPTPPVPGVPEGAINGLFTINDNGDQVYFSQGNLQYQASTNTWRFAENQWDYVGSEVVLEGEGEPGGNVAGSSNHLISEYYDGWIDLFGWGTSNYNHGAVCYHPWSTSPNGSDYYAYGNYIYNLYDQTGQADWGYNSISNGGNRVNIWRTLKQEEMSYVFYSRGVEVSFVRALVNGVKGIILLPDDWIAVDYQFNSPNMGNVPYDENVVSSSVWQNDLEARGAVFFPAAGLRRGTTIRYVNSWGQYALSTAYGEYEVYRFGFDEGITVPSDVGSSWRDICFSVRLVQDAQ